MRDDFSSSIKDTLGKRVGLRCSNPGCRKATSGPQDDPNEVVNIGVAAHIRAASPGGKRYDPLQTATERCSVMNGIWLCQNCAKLIDNDEARYSPEILYQWKGYAEKSAQREIELRVPDVSKGSIISDIGLFLGENDRIAMQARHLKAFYRPQLCIYGKAIQDASITIIRLRNQGHLANQVSVVFPLCDRKIEKMIVNKQQLDTDEVLTVTLVGNLLIPPIRIQVHISFMDITGRIYQQDYYKLSSEEELTEPQLVDNINKGKAGVA